jgi:predicted permease
MRHILFAILPVFLVIAVGALAKRSGFPGAGFWVPAERLTYYLLFPALIVATLARAELGGLALGPMAAALVAGPLAVTPLLLALRPVSGLSGPAFTSVFQGAIRFNTYIGLAVAFGLRGAEGVAAAAVAIAVLAVFGNLLSVTVLAAYGAASRPGALAIVKQVIGNPLILAALLGMGLNGSGLGLPPVVEPTFEILARAALALGLLAVGAGLDFAAVRRQLGAIAFTSAVKLLVVPAFTAGACWALGVSGLAAFTAVLFNGLPAAPSAYILARQLGGDAGLMAGILTAQIALAVVTLPLVLAVFL